MSNHNEGHKNNTHHDDEDVAIFIKLLPIFMVLGFIWFYLGEEKSNENNKAEIAAQEAEDQEDRLRAIEEEETYEINKKVNNAAVTGTAVSAGTHQGAKNADHVNSDATGKYRIDANGDLRDGDGRLIAKAGTFAEDASGNLITESGALLVKAGGYVNSIRAQINAKPTRALDTDAAKFTVDGAGNLVDAKGEIIAMKGEFMEKDGNYVDKNGNLLGKIFIGMGKAIGSAANATADAFKGVFSGIFKKKEAVVGRTYGLRQTKFKENSHLLANNSKAEVQGLADALKEYPDAKIQVQVHTDDQADGKNSKKLSELRAEVVSNMLVTLGVNKNQISYKGMGSKDDAKATADKLEILIEK